MVPVKYPRTPHLPGSPGSTSDDKWLSEAALNFLSSGIELVATEKMDGGNITLARDFMHARSTDSQMGAYENRAKARWQEFRHEIPENLRISAESLYARRSVGYEDLADVLLVFGMWEDDLALSWREVKEYAELLGLSTVPELYVGNDFEKAVNIWRRQQKALETLGTPRESEGFVVRNAGSFAMEDFSLNVAKWVRADHVRTTADWRSRDDFELNGFRA